MYRPGLWLQGESKKKTSNKFKIFITLRNVKIDVYDDADVLLLTESHYLIHISNDTTSRLLTVVVMYSKHQTKHVN